MSNSPYTKLSTITTTKAEQPLWQAPLASSVAAASQLKIYNSLTRTKTPFVPIDPSGRKVTWYCCGPTVYDAGHLGHARNYVTTDVIRRIVEGYFGYEVQFVQNVTDIDDKIILRARQSYLFRKFTETNPEPTEEVLSTIDAAWQAYVKKIFPSAQVTPATFLTWATKTLSTLINSDGTISTAEPTESQSSQDIEKDAKTKMHLKTLVTSAAAINHPPKDTNELYTAAKDILAPFLDKKDGHSVTDPKIFRETAAYWEKHFNDDMATLNVLPPTITTRVSEFVPENVKFIETIVEKGFGYPTADGSVYFNVESYRASGHHYAKLQPWNASVDALLQDGEGALGSTDGKKNKGDFALWKSSKSGEPGWESPWGKGRPGWHIECSVMCSEVLGNQVDIHSGGIDLAFPHHDNEIAQAEAYWDPCTATHGTEGEKHQWVNYFIHMGHLEISGAKMSKSLKNFVSIREALGRGGGWTSRRLRIVFLMGSWKDRIEIREGVISEAKNWESTISKFFTNVKSLRAEQDVEEETGGSVPQLFGEREHALYRDFDKARDDFHTALCDSFNTPAAMSTVLDLVSKSNIYLSVPKSYKSIAVLSAIARWLTKTVHIFGLDTAPISPTTIGWSDNSADASSDSGVNKEDLAMPYVRVLSNFRDKVRKMAVANPKDSLMQDLLTLCDTVRDDDLPSLGVSLDDRDTAAGKPALVKFVPAEILLAERQEKQAKAAEKEAKKEELKCEKERKEREKLEEGKLSHLDMFKEGKEGEVWTEWDEDGLPTKDKEGEPVGKSKGKALKKAWDRQKKLHEQYLAWVQSTGESSR